MFPFLFSSVISVAWFPFRILAVGWLLWFSVRENYNSWSLIIRKKASSPIDIVSWWQESFLLKIKVTNQLFLLFYTFLYLTNTYLLGLHLLVFFICMCNVHTVILFQSLVFIWNITLTTGAVECIDSSAAGKKFFPTWVKCMTLNPLISPLVIRLHFLCFGDVKYSSNAITSRSTLTWNGCTYYSASPHQNEQYNHLLYLQRFNRVKTND